MSKPNRRKKFWLYGSCIVVLLTALYLLLSERYQEEEKSLRTQLRQSVKDNFPEQAQEFAKGIGLFPFGNHSPGGAEMVLVHGLDDPGKVWQDLAPALQAEGYNVWQMHYPNDQPVAESTLLFLSELKALPQKDIDRITVIGHSMGGLVTRELLTTPDINYDQLVLDGSVPDIERFIMVGTPNHGSQLARFRFFAEFRDHLERLRNGEANWLGSILDGAGEAKIDLVPGSRFLTELNSRPYPPGLDSLIIAGITSPWSEQDIQRQSTVLAEKVPANYREDVNTLGEYLVSMTHGLGDGLVTVESTRLDNVPHVQVSGTHLTMIRNISADSGRIPPAVPIILDWLEAKP